MTARQFIDAGYAILVEEYQRLGIDLLTAVEKVSDLGMTPRTVEAAGTPDRVDNDRSMSMLTSMMAGVKGAPV